MSTSLTWQELPAQLLEPVMDGHLALWEAAWLMDEWLLTPEGGSRTLSPELWAAAEKLTLLEMEASPTQH